MLPAKLTKRELNKVLKAVDVTNRGDQVQRYRLVKFLTENPRATTSEIRNGALIGNISDIAGQANDLLSNTGFFVHCEIGETVTDRFGAKHKLFHWSLFRDIPIPNQQQAQAESVRGAF